MPLLKGPLLPAMIQVLAAFYLERGISFFLACPPPRLV